MMIRSTATAAALSAVWLLATTSSCQATTKDPNSYLWESSGKQNKFKMYWSDAANVLADLTSFQSLHVKVHGCV